MNATLWIAILVVGLAATIVMNVRLRRALAQARHEAMHDPLTRLLRGSGAGHYFAKWQRRGQACSAIMLDLDDFKEINDRYGHQAGDQVLTAIGRRLAGHARRLHGVAARLGGDEFLLLLPALAPADYVDQTLAVLDDLRSPVDTDSHTAKAVLRPSATAGIATVGAGDDWTRLVRAADLALYQAKHRDIPYCFYQPNMRAPFPTHEQGPGHEGDPAAPLRAIHGRYHGGSRRQAAPSAH